MLQKIITGSCSGDVLNISSSSGQGLEEAIRKCRVVSFWKNLQDCQVSSILLNSVKFSIFPLRYNVWWTEKASCAVRT